MILKKICYSACTQKKEEKKRRKTDLKYVTVHVQKKVNKKTRKIDNIQRWI